jgi:hypothetical protein
MSYTAPSVAASGTTFAQFQAGGASGHLELLIAAQAATAAPSVAATLAANGAAHTLAAATYFVTFTESNGFGETTQAPASAAQAVTAGQQLVVTFPSLQSGNTSRNLYLGLSNTGPWTLYASGIASSPYDATTAAPANSFAVSPPTVNGTGLTSKNATTGVVENKTLSLLRAAKDGNLEDVYAYLRNTIADFNRGEAVTFNGEIAKLRHAHVVFAMLSTLCSEMGTLIDANAGTLNYGMTNGIGNAKVKRTWP